MNLQVRKDYTKEALYLANTRVAEFENRLLSKMEQVNGALEAFTDPSFQLLLVEAQKASAATERIEDYDLLSELLLYRFEKGEDRFIRAGISRAVEIVDKISNDALVGLTTLHAVSSFFPDTGDVYRGLNILDDLFGKILYRELPIGNDWIDHLDILDAVRFDNNTQLIPIQEYYPEYLTGYVDVGIQKNSEDYNQAISILEQSELPQSILVEHVFNCDFVRLNIYRKNQISSLKLSPTTQNSNQGYPSQIEPSKDQRAAISSIYGLYQQDSILKQENIELFMKEWDQRTNLKILKEWWNSINVGIQTTSVGKVLAHSNAQRCDTTLPPLNP